MPSNRTLKMLMETLYYPAVLGAGLFVVASRAIGDLANYATNVGFYYSIVLLVYFSISFLLTTRISEAQYKPHLFVLDSIEALLLLAMFTALGFAETSQRTVDLTRFYWILLVIPVLQFVWRWNSGQDRWKRNWAVGLGVLIAILGISLRFYAPCIDWVLFGALAALVFAYASALR